MASSSLVDGAGWISDESSFYGDDEVVAAWEDEAERALGLPSELSLHPVARKQKLTKHERNVDGDGHSKSTASRASQQPDDILDFLKNRPQISKLQNDSAQDRKGTVSAQTAAAGTEEASDLVKSDHFKGRSDSWQQDESIDDFLKRLPVTDPNTALVGPWLWVSSSSVGRFREERRAEADANAFKELGSALIGAFVKQRTKIEADDPGKAPATITRKMGPYRDQLEEDLLSAAVKTGTTCGKWMLFPNSTDLPRYWRIVAQATSQGKLGPVAKVATPDPYNGKDETLICVYTYDFTDVQDVRRVLDELVELGLCRKDGRPIFYKCDAYTYMDITSSNDYKLRASLYSSAELFKNAPKPMIDGPVARLKKRDHKIDSFFS